MTNLSDWERNQVDPEGRYEVSGLMEVERHALRLNSLLPSYRMERTCDVFQFTLDLNTPVLVDTREFLELSLPRAEWPHPNVPAPSSRFWKRVEWNGLEDATLILLVDDAREARQT